MAQKGNDNQKDGVVSSYPDNVHQGLYTGGGNSTPLGLATKEDGDEADRGPSMNHKSGWVLTPGID